MKILVHSEMPKQLAPRLTLYGVQSLGSMLAQAQERLAVGQTTAVEGWVVDGQFKAELEFGHSRLPFKFYGVNEADSLDIWVRNPLLLWLQWGHSIPMPGPCSAVCWDGTSGQPCVDCRKDGIRYRICC